MISGESSVSQSALVGRAALTPLLLIPPSFYLHFHSMEVKGNRVNVNVMGEFNHAGDLQYVLQV